MDKPELPIRMKIVQQSFSETDANGHVLRASCETTRELEDQRITKRIHVELMRPETPLSSRLRLTRFLSQGDVDLFLTAADKILTLLQRRENQNERTPSQGVEFSIDVVDGVKLGAFVTHGSEPSQFIELHSEKDNIRFEFSGFDRWDVFKQVFQHAI
ncbi:MAG TPA: hypothetical protein VNP98_17070 [Chthoniobacterales bacterium]|nr:hypothetical protein [Chthoniobacterales bacterium]